MLSSALRGFQGPAVVRLLVAGSVVGVLAGCSGKSTPTAPPSSSSITPIPLASAWPHENGRSFGYRYIVQTGTSVPDQLYPSAAEVPPVTLDQVAALLEQPPQFNTAYAESVGYELVFQDSAMTGSGVRGQNLVAAVTVYPLPAPRTGPAGPSGTLPSPPRFLPGGVWRQEATRIAGFTDLSTEPTWIFLDGALADRTEWSAHLAPGFADDILLRARAFQTVTAYYAGLRFDDALDVHYLLDHGVESVTDTQGSVIGYRRVFDYARIVWGRDTGPLYLYERDGLTAGTPPTPGLIEARLVLERTSVAAPPAGSW